MADVVQLVRFQIAHSAWALGEIIRHAKPLATSAIEQDMGIGPGSLRDNLAHTLEAMIYFAENFAGRDYDTARYANVERCSKTLDGLEELLGIAHARLRESMVSVCERGLPERVLWPNAEGGSMPWVTAVAQVFDHATLHRAQCVNMLKRLGVDPAPDLDPMTFRSRGLSW
ncbi:MAG: DinB family protein [Phycisphaerales bacterium]